MSPALAQAQRLVHRRRQQVDRARAQAVYLIYVRVRPGDPGGPNVECIGAKLSRSAAEAQAARIPGAWTEKVMADK